MKVVMFSGNLIHCYRNLLFSINICCDIFLHLFL